MTQTGAHATQRRMAGVVQHERLTRRSALALQPHGASHRKAAIDFFFEYLQHKNFDEHPSRTPGTPLRIVAGTGIDQAQAQI